MTREQNLQIIKDACVKANPEIMELKWGYGIKWQVRNSKISGRFIGTQPNGEFPIEFEGSGMKETFDSERFFAVGELEILGRDIILSDVLLLIKWSTQTPLEKNEAILALIYTYWNLNIPLHEQSDITVAFIANLLPNN